MGVLVLGQVFALLFGASYGLSNLYLSKGVDYNHDSKLLGQYITLLINSIINITVFVAFLIYGIKIEYNIAGILFFSVAGFFNSFLSRGIFLMTIPYIGVSRAGIFKVTSPVFAILGGVIFLNEKFIGKGLIGAIIVIIGIFCVSLETVKRNQCSQYSKNGTDNKNTFKSKKGILLGILSGFLLGIGNVFRKIGVNYIPSSILGVTLGSLIALISIVVFHAIYGNMHQLLIATKRMNKDYLMSGIFSSIALYLLFLSLKYIPVSYSNSIGVASESLFTICWSFIILGNKESVTVRTFISAVIVIIGIIMLMTSV